MSDLIINGIDHSKFDLEWAKRGGIVYHYGDFCRYICDGDNYNEIRAGQDGEHIIGVEKTVGLISILTIEKVENIPYYMRMATPSECAEAGIEYIEPPARWLPIESAPKNKLVLLYRKTVENDLIYVGGYRDGEWCTENGKVTNEPHYWMPLKLPNALAQAEAQHDQRQNA